ncbi:MAG: NrfD/PsrC family molybdoenzyme membrane anchor subunit [Candidatus Eisenbacteria bacterium]
MHELTGFLFPNDVHIHWSLMIVLYPYITGLVAGAFLVSSLYHVFGKEEFRPLGRFALATALCFLAVATLPLLNHLGHPERAANIVITPHFTSAMAGFGLLYTSYFLVLLLEVWFVFRPDIVHRVATTRGWVRWFYASLALGVYDLSPEALELDRKIIRVLAAIGIPMACLLHGYVGFLFGALKANPWWSTPLMPIIFLFSAMVSGIALLIVLYQVAMKLKGWAIDGAAVSALARWLWLFLIMTLTLELLEIMTLAYERAEEWEVISHLLTNQLSISFISIQMVLGGLIPFILLIIVVLLDRYMDDRIRNTLTMVASLLLLMQVIAMRWNVVIGGQMFSKSMRGFRETYVPGLWDKEGIGAAVLILVIPFVLLLVFERILPTFAHLERESETTHTPTAT